MDVCTEILLEPTLRDGVNFLQENLVIRAEHRSIQKDISNKQVVINAVKYIEENYNNPELRMTNVAKFVGLSKSYFSIVFKTIKGKSFTDYLIDIRINKARYLLENTNQRGYQVSYMVGYNNPTYFSSTFKKYTGESPSEYVKRIRK